MPNKGLQAFLPATCTFGAIVWDFLVYGGVMDFEKYRPSNASEGESFYTTWCAECERERSFLESGGDGCLIYVATMVLDTDDPEYPKDWVYDEQGVPCCTAFIHSGSCLPAAKLKEEAGQLRLFPRVAE